MSTKPVSRQANIVVQELENEVLIYDLTINKAFCLNETSAIIWQLCDGTKTVSEISQAVGKKFKANISEGFIWLALEQLKKDSLVESEALPPIEFLGMSRREIIRKVGLASMVALPVVASMIAPTAVNAQSACILSNMSLSCTTSGQCCDNGLCVGTPSVCSCVCVNPGDCVVQTGCPSTVNCNLMGQCAP